MPYTRRLPLKPMRPLALNPKIPPIVVLAKEYAEAQPEPAPAQPMPNPKPRPRGGKSATRALQAAAKAPCVRERKPGTPIVFEYPECWNRPVNWWAFDGRRTLGK